MKGSMIIRKIALFLIFSILFIFCFSCTTKTTHTNASSKDQAKKYNLKVALFPWIPDSANDDFESLKERLKKEFERRYPDIELTLRLKKWDDSYYNPPKIAGWLASEKYDLVEIDTVILGDLISAEVIEPWLNQEASEFFTAAVQGSVVKDDGTITWWSVPHLLCGFFIVSKSYDIDSATTISELNNAVIEIGKPIFGNFDSSWDLPSLYLDSLIDNGMNRTQAAEALEPPLNPKGLAALRNFASFCNFDGSNPCTNGQFDDNWNDPVLKFLSGEAVGYWGYSERLHFTVSELKKAELPTDDLRVNTIPLGDNTIPLLFTDSFVKRVGCAEDPSCSNSVEAFINFINSDWANEEILLSGDAKASGVTGVPRYLLPAKKSAFNIEGIKEDHLYKELKPYAEAGIAMPNTSSMYEKRKLMEWLIINQLPQ